MRVVIKNTFLEAVDTACSLENLGRMRRCRSDASLIPNHKELPAADLRQSHCDGTSCSSWSSIEESCVSAQPGPGFKEVAPDHSNGDVFWKSSQDLSQEQEGSQNAETDIWFGDDDCGDVVEEALTAYMGQYTYEYRDGGGRRAESRWATYDANSTTAAWSSWHNNKAMKLGRRARPSKSTRMMCKRAAMLLDTGSEDAVHVAGDLLSRHNTYMTAILRLKAGNNPSESLPQSKAVGLREAQQAADAQQVCQRRRSGRSHRHDWQHPEPWQKQPQCRFGGRRSAATAAASI